ncbi:hypothetical protein KP509_20G082700 [Ceratopteris richardii]|uniref:Uncharacterized protein n=1 Tax=Ceratopteris richardii TaxID=49495 RepID=A0A8T2SJY7_CERRI|nr:hypothetical protein KP509_20G082700 [Ceratopteris richardii]
MEEHRKLWAGLTLLALLVVVFAAKGEAIRNLAVKEDSEISLGEQEQLLRFQEDMETAKRHLLTYDPYFHHWYGGKDHHWKGGKDKH